MADNKLPRDELEALRWFRQRLRHLTRTYPQLTSRKQQERLTAYLAQQATEEQEPCPDNPPASPEADQQAAGTSTRPGA